MAGLLGTFGFSAYSPTKFAIRGLGEVLVFEGRPYNISMRVGLPALPCPAISWLFH
jgi:3-dehydrosphinganine reductase